MSHSFLCEGCEKDGFTMTGYWSHLQQSKDPRCTAILHALNNSMDLDSSSESDSGNQDPNWDDFDDTVQPIPFAGDAFGSPEDYGDEDFGQSDDDDLLEEQLAQSNVSEDLDDQEDLEQAAAAAELEEGWEPIREIHNIATAPLEEHNAQDPLPEDGEPDSAQIRWAAEERLDVDPLVIHYATQYPQSRCGAIKEQRHTSDQHYASVINNSSNIWAPFVSEIDWKVAKWAKLRGAGSTAFSDLLAIDGVCDALGLSYKNTNELNKVIDKNLPRRPAFKRHEVVVAGEAFELYSRDIIECIKALWSDPEFAPFLVFQPERHYADDDHTIRMYHDMHTGKWWWATQKEVEKKTSKKGITIVPIIISSDKTQLTTFCNKLAYPVYMTIGNIPKHIHRKPSRQGQVLLAYLPTSKLSHISNKSARRRALANFFHACMGFILHPLEEVGLTGLELTSGDGAVRDGHPIFASYVGDYPEQILVTCVKTGECPTCPVPRDELGDPDGVSAPRELDDILDALDTIDQGATAFTRACKEAGIKPIQQPFWKNLPFVNIYRSITPDILHQLYQGMIKHLISWIRSACGDTEIDARCRRLPPNHNIRLFLKGISHLSRITGTEHDQICRFLLGIIIDIHLPHGFSNVRLLRAVRGMLDFLYLAKYPVHTTETLDELEKSLEMFNTNRQIFVDLGIHVDFNFPKGHFTGHYRYLIELYGTADNFNTEYTERLHINLAKDAYRSTNSKDEYPQMTAWLDRREQVLLHDKFIQRRLSVADNIHQPCTSTRPSVYGVSLETIKTSYGASQFEAALSRLVVHVQHPQFSRRQVELAASDLHIPFRKLSVFHRLKFISHDPFSVDPLAEIVMDSIHCEPSRHDKNGQVIPGRFDTAVINHKNGGKTGVKGYCIGQIRCVFTLPSSAVHAWFGSRKSPLSHLAYVEWFTPFASLRPGQNHGLYKISRHRINGNQQASVIPISLIRQSVHLLPAFGPVAPPSWKSSSVLEAASHFYVNSFSDRFPYSTLY
ncbi:hypothetical protein BDZ97DRAFT_1992200 [Flammula alnicola]|nr:hypothetical protein BDZ97DRAFT_1992200 [Flammula alnicola]